MKISLFCAFEGGMRRRAMACVLSATPGLVLACSPAPAPVSRASTDPSSPNAPEGVVAEMSSASPAHGNPPSAHSHAHARSGADAAPQATTYVCPMHREVTSSTPGVCPKCGMQLVPKR